MATTKKKTPARKSSKARTKAKTSRKAAPKKKAKPAAEKSTVKKSSAKKPAAKPSRVSTKANPIPAGREHKLAEQALKLVDEAASVLRTGIRSGAQTTAKSRIAAKKKANDLLGKASSNLSKAIDGSASALQNLLGKL